MLLDMDRCSISVIYSLGSFRFPIPKPRTLAITHHEPTTSLFSPTLDKPMIDAQARSLIAERNNEDIPCQVMGDATIMFPNYLTADAQLAGDAKSTWKSFQTDSDCTQSLTVS